MITLRNIGIRTIHVTKTASLPRGQSISLPDDVAAKLQRMYPSEFVETKDAPTIASAVAAEAKPAAPGKGKGASKGASQPSAPSAPAEPANQPPAAAAAS